MNDLWKRLEERRLFRWAFAYVAAAWVAIEVMASLGDLFGVPLTVQRALVVVLAFGLVLTLIVAWHHGERGPQRITGAELLLIAGALSVAGLTLTFMRTNEGSEPRTPSSAPASTQGAPPDPASVAVLPFSDLSQARDQEYFSAGVAEELRSVLSRVDGLRVASTTSSLAVQSAGLDPSEIGARLGVASLVEGSVRKAADRLRIEARLVSVEDGFQMWSGSFDVDAADIFAVQDSIALSVARALEIRLAGGAADLDARGQTTDHVAQDLYLRGRFAWNRRTQEGLEEAVDFFRSAVGRDSTYARALSGLADAYAVLGFYDYRPPSVAFPLAQEAARAALGIDSTLAEPYATLGYAALYHDWDFEKAEARFLQAIALDPGYPVAHQWYANYLTARGRFPEAIREMRVASELDPLSTIAFAAIGWVHLYAKDYDRAISQLEATVARDPSFELAYLWSGQAYEGLGELGRAEALIRHSVDMSDGSALARAALARVLGLADRTEEAHDILRTLEGEGRAGYVPSYEIARAYVGLSDTEAALRWLERAATERAHSVAFLGVDPQLDPLRSEPRFQRLLERTGIGGW